MSQLLILLMLVPTALIGVIANWLVIIGTWNSRSLSRSFSLLTINQAFFNEVFTTLCLFYAVPMIALEIKFLIANSHHYGFIMMICYDASIHTPFLIAVNRFTAVFFPLFYTKLFSSKSTKLLILTSFLASLGFISYFFQYLPCQLYYSPQLYSFTFADNETCWNYETYGAVFKMLTIRAFNVILDMITIWKVRRIKKKMRKGQPQVASCQKKEIDCLRQSFAQSLYALLFSLIDKVLPLFPINSMIIFALSITVWSLFHSLDGVLTLCFNSEIRKSLRWSRSSSLVAVNSLPVVEGKP